MNDQQNLYPELSVATMNYVLKLQNILDTSSSLTKPENKEIILEGRPTSSQTNSDLSKYISLLKDKLKQKKFSHVFSGRIKVNFQWHLRERDFFENPNIPGLDNLPIKKIIDELRNPGYGLFIDDIQVDEINMTRIILAPDIRARYNDNDQREFEKLVIKIASNEPEDCSQPMIKRDDIDFISLTPFPGFRGDRWYPIAKSESEFNQVLDDYLNLTIKAEISIGSIHSERLRHITVFPKNRINCWKKQS